MAPQLWPNHPRLLGKLHQETCALTAYHKQIGDMFAEGIVEGFSDQFLVSKNGMVGTCRSQPGDWNPWWPSVLLGFLVFLRSEKDLRACYDAAIKKWGPQSTVHLHWKKSHDPLVRCVDSTGLEGRMRQDFFQLGMCIPKSLKLGSLGVWILDPKSFRLVDVHTEVKPKASLIPTKSSRCFRRQVMPKVPATKTKPGKRPGEGEGEEPAAKRKGKKPKGNKWSPSKGELFPSWSICWVVVWTWVSLLSSDFFDEVWNKTKTIWFFGPCSRFQIIGLRPTWRRLVFFKASSRGATWTETVQGKKHVCGGIGVQCHSHHIFSVLQKWES